MAASKIKIIRSWYLVLPVLIMLGIIGCVVIYSLKLLNLPKSDNANAVDWVTVGSNTLVIAQLNTPTRNEELGFIFTLEQNDADRHVISVTDLAGKPIDTISFAAVGDRDYIQSSVTKSSLVKLNSTTTTSVQLIIIPYNTDTFDMKILDETATLH